MEGGIGCKGDSSQDASHHPGDSHKDDSAIHGKRVYLGEVECDERYTARMSACTAAIYHSGRFTVRHHRDG
jgi:hypothetical protein